MLEPIAPSQCSARRCIVCFDHSRAEFPNLSADKKLSQMHETHNRHSHHSTQPTNWPERHLGGHFPASRLFKRWSNDLKGSWDLFLRIAKLPTSCPWRLNWSRSLEMGGIGSLGKIFKWTRKMKISGHKKFFKPSKCIWECDTRTMGLGIPGILLVLLVQWVLFIAMKVLWKTLWKSSCPNV